MATLSGKTVLVIGGSGGMGYSVAKASLVAQASEVLIASSSTSRVDKAVKELQALAEGSKLPGKVKGCTLDASSTDALRAFFEKIGEIDHLAWTGGDPVKSIGFPAPSVSIESVKDMFDVRFWGPVSTAQFAKIRPGGSIILTSGSVASLPSAGFALCGSVGGAIDSLTRGMALDLAKKDVRVNCVSPGVIDTSLWDQVPPEMKAGYFAQQLPKQLVQHIGTPEEVAEAFLFFMKCTYVTGQSLLVDGGVLFQ